MHTTYNVLNNTPSHHNMLVPHTHAELRHTGGRLHFHKVAAPSHPLNPHMMQTCYN
jgi:hypothetical protein